MTTSTERSIVLPSFGEPTTAVPADFGALPELSTPQERYDSGFKRGYMAGYAEGARAAEAERAAELAAQKTSWAAKEARASALVSQLASATEGYLKSFMGRDIAMTERLLLAAFELAEAVVQCELRTRPSLAFDVARAVIADLPSGPAVVRVNPADRRLVEQAASQGASSALTIVGDPSVGPGGCVVTAGAKTADARIEEALRRAKEALLGQAGAAGHDGRAQQDRPLAAMPPEKLP